MNSWDCFDTLIARRHYHPASVFEEVGRRLKMPEFPKLRRKAEKRSDGTYNDIYKNLPNIDPNIERNLELEHCFPIVENINKVRDGDIIVSDIYFEPEFVEQLLRKNGLKKNVKFYVTSSGKRKGWIWNQVPEKYFIKNHYGDNYKSDVSIALNYGVRGKHYTGNLFTEIEEEISKQDFQLACWMRYTRLQCPYQEGDVKRQYWIEQANYNLPILVLATYELPLNKKIAFTYRDCHNWQKVYEKLTQKKGIRFDTSRRMYFSANPEFRKYVDSIIDKDTIIVDLQGEGHSIWNYFNQKPPRTIYLGGSDKTLPYVEKLIPYATKNLERYNSYVEGPVENWCEYGPIRGTNDHNIDIAEVQMQAIDTAVNVAHWFNPRPNKKLLLELTVGLSKTITGRIPWAKSNKRA